MEPDVLDISVVIPVFNEEENLGPLLAETVPVLESMNRSFEILCVDDASTDGSLEVLRELQRKYPPLRVISHRVNCGESAAEATGFAHARGRWIVTMDADQQNDPADIPALIKATSGADAVCGVRRKRQDDWVKRISSKIANGFRNRITGDRISDAGCTFRALRREALREIPRFNGMHRFLPTLLRLQGYRVVEISVNHRPRTRGESKYGVGNRAMRGLVDCFAVRWWRRRCFPTERCRTDTEDTTR
ncbi:MAG: glycosyltransferase [Deltaproteobacteria bacterium]|nr:MAG: glycosyltransferase [Deltaproteobacteria bacterium]